MQHENQIHSRNHLYFGPHGHGGLQFLQDSATQTITERRSPLHSGSQLSSEVSL
jgi:hypothetical protein